MISDTTHTQPSPVQPSPAHPGPAQPRPVNMDATPTQHGHNMESANIQQPLCIDISISQPHHLLKIIVLRVPFDLPIMPTAAQRDRTQMRQKLSTGQYRAVDGRGCGPVPESQSRDGKPGLVQLWPQYLNAEFAAAKPTLTMPDGLIGHAALPQHGLPPPGRRKG